MEHYFLSSHLSLSSKVVEKIHISIHFLQAKQLTRGITCLLPVEFHRKDSISDGESNWISLIPNFYVIPADACDTSGRKSDRDQQSLSIWKSTLISLKCFEPKLIDLPWICRVEQ